MSKNFKNFNIKNYRFSKIDDILYEYTWEHICEKIFGKTLELERTNITLLMLAAKKGFDHIFDELVYEHGFDPLYGLHTSGRPHEDIIYPVDSFLFATYGGFLSIIEKHLIFENSEIVKASINNIIVVSIIKERNDIFDFFFERIEKLNEIFEEMKKFLSKMLDISISRGNIYAMRKILDLGGHSPRMMHIAATRFNIEAMKILFNYCDMHQYYKGETPLTLSIFHFYRYNEKNFYETFDFLIDFSNCNLRCVLGYTPIFRAIVNLRNTCPEIFKKLLAKSDLTLKSDSGLSLLEKSLFEGNFFLELLKFSNEEIDFDYLRKDDGTNKKGHIFEIVFNSYHFFNREQYLNAVIDKIDFTKKIKGDLNFAAYLIERDNIQVFLRIIHKVDFSEIFYINGVRHTILTYIISLDKQDVFIKLSEQGSIPKDIFKSLKF